MTTESNSQDSSRDSLKDTLWNPDTWSDEAIQEHCRILSDIELEEINDYLSELREENQD